MTDTQELTQTVNGLIADMAVLKIENDTTAEQAGMFLRKNKETQKFVKEYFEDARKTTYDAYKAVTDQIKFFTDKLAQAEKTVKRKVADYRMEQERIRREEERRLAEEARKEEEERRLAEAMETGNEKILDVPIEVSVKTEEPKKMDGVSFVEKWTFKIQDANQIPREYLIPDEKKIRGVVNSLKDKANIPGVRIYADKTVRVL